MYIHTKDKGWFVYIYTYTVIILCPKRNIFQLNALHSTLPFSIGM